MRYLLRDEIGMVLGCRSVPAGHRTDQGRSLIVKAPREPEVNEIVPNRPLRACVVRGLARPGWGAISIYGMKPVGVHRRCIVHDVVVRAIPVRQVSLRSQ